MVTKKIFLSAGLLFCSVWSGVMQPMCSSAGALTRNLAVRSPLHAAKSRFFGAFALSKGLPKVVTTNSSAKPHFVSVKNENHNYRQKPTTGSWWTRISSLLALVGIAKASNDTVFAQDDEKNNKKAVVVQLTDVLFSQSLSDISSAIGRWQIAQYRCSNGAMPDTDLFKLFDSVAKKEQDNNESPVMYGEYQLPRCFKKWYCGNISSAQLEKEACSIIDDNNEISESHKTLFKHMVHVLTDAKTYQSITKPNKDVVAWIAELKRQGHAIVVYANMPPEHLSVLADAHRDVFGMVDRTIIPRDNNALTHEPTTLNDLLKVVGNSGFMIHNDLRTMSAAEQMGLSVVEYKNIAQAKEAAHKHLH